MARPRCPRRCVLASLVCLTAVLGAGTADSLGRRPTLRRSLLQQAEDEATAWTAIATVASNYTLFAGTYCNGTVANGDTCDDSAAGWTGEVDVVELGKCLGGVRYSCSDAKGAVLEIFRGTGASTCSASATKSSYTVVSAAKLGTTTYNAKTNSSERMLCAASLAELEGATAAASTSWVLEAEYFGTDTCDAEEGAGHFTLRAVDRCVVSGSLSRVQNNLLAWLPQAPPIFAREYIKLETFEGANEATCGGAPSGVEYFLPDTCLDLADGGSSLRATCDGDGGFAQVKYSKLGCTGTPTTLRNVSAAEVAAGACADAALVRCGVGTFDASDAATFAFVGQGYAHAEGAGTAAACAGVPAYYFLGKVGTCQEGAAGGAGGGWASSARAAGAAGGGNDGAAAATATTETSRENRAVNRPTPPDPFPSPPTTAGPDGGMGLESWQLILICVAAAVVVALFVAVALLVRRPMKRRKLSSAATARSARTTAHSALIEGGSGDGGDGGDDARMSVGYRGDYGT